MQTATCHPNRKHKAKGLCGPCYEQHLRAINSEYKARQYKNSRTWKNKRRAGDPGYRAEDTRRQRSHPDAKSRRRNAALRRKYGIDIAQYENLLQSQNGGCAICHREPGIRPLHVDHDHHTGKVRGLLCHQCNWYLGTIDADPQIIQRIIAYRKTL